MTAKNGIRTTDKEAPLWWPSSRTAHTFAVVFWLLSLALFRRPLSSLASLSLQDENSSHILLIPLISAVILYLQRKRIFEASRFCPFFGIPLILLPIVWYSIRAPLSSMNHTDGLSVVTSLIVLGWLAIFLLSYGPSSFWAAMFPLLFLVLMVPMPVVLLEHTISALQRGSAEACNVLFRVMGVPFVRHDMHFSLPGVDIEVAKQCSGIHSGLSLFIAGLLLEHTLLKGAWKKAAFILCIFPIAIFKNAVRIVTISWLGIHVDRAFFYGTLHHQGGLPFSLLAIALMIFLIWVLSSGSFFPGYRPSEASLKKS